MQESELLTPILATGFGRTGSTAVMAVIGTDDRVAFDRRYPMEQRHLTYLAKFALLASRNAVADVDAEKVYDFGHNGLVPPPWAADPPEFPRFGPTRTNWLAYGWQAFSNAVRAQQPRASFYAEKAPPWLPPMAREAFAVKVVHLVRDPRDVYLSARDFTRDRQGVGFGMDADRSEAQRARFTAHRWLVYAENERADRGRADAVLFRYEDWIADPVAAAAHLGVSLGLALQPDAPEIVRNLDRHKTSADLASSVARWQRESLPEEVDAILASQLASTMADYGYECSSNHPPVEPLVPRPEWDHSRDGEWSPCTDGAAVTVIKGDAYIELPPDPFPAEETAEVWVCLKGNTGDHTSLYWRASGESFVQARSISMPFYPSPHWQIVRMIVGEHPLWRGSIHQLRLDVFNGAVVGGGGGVVRWIRRVA